MDVSIIQIVIQAGAVGIAFFALYINWKLVSNHIAHNTKSQQELTVAIKELSTIIKSKGLEQ